MQKRHILAAALPASLLSACVSGPAPVNHASARWAPGQVDFSGHHPEGDWNSETAQPIASCGPRDPLVVQGTQVALEALGAASHVLAPGDRLHVQILGDPDGFSGIYAIGSDGTIALGNAVAADASGRELAAFEAELRARLVAKGLVRDLRNAVRVRLAEAAGVAVGVSGAVFQPGEVRAGERSPESRIGQKEGEASGDANVTRTVSAAIRAAGGVRPDSDISRIVLKRGGRYAIIDMSGLLGGGVARDPIVTRGDRIVVPATDCFQPELVRPTPLTQPGIRVFVSNLTRSANNNAGAAIGEKTGSLPYGTRLLQALVAMNCVGGSYMQADRRAVLISRNPRTGQAIVIERDVEKLVRAASRDSADPYLMPGDAIACYDSRWTNFREALGLIGDVAGTVTPALLLEQAID